MQRLFELATECVKNSITCELLYSSERNAPFFRIHIGSKTGGGDLYEDSEGGIVIETRYQKKNVVEFFDDIAFVAFDWYLNYKNREPFTQPDSQWVSIFEQKGWIKKIVKTEYITT